MDNILFCMLLCYNYNTPTTASEWHLWWMWNATAKRYHDDDDNGNDNQPMKEKKNVERMKTIDRGTFTTHV